MKLIYKVMLFSIVAIVTGIAVYSSGKKAERNYRNFMTASINGELSYIYESTSGVYFRIKGNENIEYNFNPYTSDELNNGLIFSRTAEVGDRVIKLSGSDTLTLFHSGEPLKYTFKHFR